MLSQHHLAKSSKDWLPKSTFVIITVNLVLEEKASLLSFLDDSAAVCSAESSLRISLAKTISQKFSGESLTKRYTCLNKIATCNSFLNIKLSDFF